MILLGCQGQSPRLRTLRLPWHRHECVVGSATVPTLENEDGGHSGPPYGEIKMVLHNKRQRSQLPAGPIKPDPPQRERISCEGQKGGKDKGSDQKREEK